MDNFFDPFVGPNPCDRRQSLQETKKSFPGIDFSAIQSDNDVFWDDVHLKPAGNGVYSVGESEEEICQRGLNFLESLLQRQAKSITNDTCLSCTIIQALKDIQPKML